MHCGKMSQLVPLLVFTLAVSGFMLEAEASVSTCPTCMYLNVSTNEEYLKRTIQSIYSNLGSNPACLQGGDGVSAKCTSTVYSKSKCQTLIMKYRGVGIKGGDPNYRMSIDSLARSCVQRPPAEPDRCIDLSELPEYTSVFMDNEYLKENVKSQSVTGWQCFTSYGGQFSPSNLPIGSADNLFKPIHTYMLFPVSFLAILYNA